MIRDYPAASSPHRCTLIYRVSTNSGMDYWNEFFDCFCLFAGYISLAEYTNTYISILVIPSLKSGYDTKSMCTM